MSQNKRDRALVRWSLEGWPNPHVPKRPECCGPVDQVEDEPRVRCEHCGRSWRLIASMPRWVGPRPGVPGQLTFPAVVDQL